MVWEVLLYSSSRQDKPIEKFIANLEIATRAKVVHKINLLEKYGNLLNMPHSKKINKNLFELRIRGKQEIRIFYCFEKHKIHLLHAFRKKSQKTPVKEIKTAMDRVNKVLVY